MSEENLILRLRTRANIRRSITTRKSVLEGKPDRIADLLEEAADVLEGQAMAIMVCRAEIKKLKQRS